MAQEVFPRFMGPMFKRWHVNVSTPASVFLLQKGRYHLCGTNVDGWRSRYQAPRHFPVCMNVYPSENQCTWYSCSNRMIDHAKDYFWRGLKTVPLCLPAWPSLLTSKMTVPMVGSTCQLLQRSTVLGVSGPNLGSCIASDELSGRHIKKDSAELHGSGEVMHFPERQKGN